MIRKIIKIDESKCDGCGLCAEACHEGAIGMVDGKAKLLREDYCDGLGDCLPACPQNAISFEEREAPEYNEQAVLAAKAAKGRPAHACPWKYDEEDGKDKLRRDIRSGPVSQLSQWPVQIKLVPVNAPYFDGANLLVAADCTAYAFGDFHNRFIKNRITLIGCPKLDEGDYTEKAYGDNKKQRYKEPYYSKDGSALLWSAGRAAVNALKNSGKFIPWQVYTITTDGRIKE